MKNTDILIVGGSAGGLTAGIAARRNYPEKSITLVRKEEEVVVPCGIPYIFETIGSVEENTMPVDQLLSKNDIESIIDEVIDLDEEEKLVKTAEGEEIGYDKLVLATGSSPVIPSIPGIDRENVFVAKKDVDYLNNMMEVLNESKKVVIIGGGFIGVEFADELSKKEELDVTVVEMLPRCLQLSFDDEFCDKAMEKLEERGVNILTDNTAEKIIGEEKVEYVRLDSGEELEADAVILGIGTKPNVELGEKAGLEVGKTDALKVDDFQRTSDVDIFAVGDCAEKRFFLTGNSYPLWLASVACREARIAVANLFGLRQKNNGALGSFVTIIGDTGFGITGFTEKTANEAGVDYVKGEFTSKDKHPGSMPGAKEAHLKLLFSKTGQLIGGQIYGGITTAEIINNLTTLIESEMRIDEIVGLQFSTHPWFTPSPVGYLITNAAETVVGEFT